MDFKLIVDTLSSLAALVAIIGLMVGWYRSARKPLRVVRVVVRKNEIAEIKEMTFIIIVKNVKEYPVFIKRTDCYKGKTYEVQKKRGGKPEYSAHYLISERIFSHKEEFEIPANAHTDIRIRSSTVQVVPLKLLFVLDTSHGHHDLWCDEVDIVEIGVAQVYGVEYRNEYRSRLRAKCAYYLALIRELASRCSRRLRRG